MSMQEEIETYVQNNMWSPEYPTLVYKKDWAVHILAYLHLWGTHVWLHNPWVQMLFLIFMLGEQCSIAFV